MMEHGTGFGPAPVKQEGAEITAADRKRMGWGTFEGLTESEKYRVVPFNTAEANYNALKSGRCRVMMELYLNSDEWRQLAAESQTSQFADACILAAKECEKVDGWSK